MSEIIIYAGKDGHIELKVNLSEETVWLTQKQLSDLFNKNVRTISEHINNIFKEGELDESSVVRNFRITATDGKLYDTKHYNLDIIILVGYRVHSKRATEFRQWATQVLKDHLVRGYTLYGKRLAERGVKELQQAIELLQKKLTRNDLVNDIGAETIQLIMSYTKTWHLLLAYDEDSLKLPVQGKLSTIPLNCEIALMPLKHSSQILQLDMRQLLFLEIIVTLGCKVSRLILDHPFSDGNKRIGCLIFLLYLKLQHSVIKLNDKGLVALALLIAESQLRQKDLMIRLRKCLKIALEAANFVKNGSKILIYYL